MMLGSFTSAAAEHPRRSNRNGTWRKIRMEVSGMFVGKVLRRESIRKWSRGRESVPDVLLEVVYDNALAVRFEGFLYKLDMQRMDLILILLLFGFELEV